MTLTLLGIAITVVLFMINYLNKRLNRIEEDLPKKIKYWSLKMSGKAINDIVFWMREELKKTNLDSEQKEVFNSSFEIIKKQ